MVTSSRVLARLVLPLSILGNSCIYASVALYLQGSGLTLPHSL